METSRDPLDGAALYPSCHSEHHFSSSTVVADIPAERDIRSVPFPTRSFVFLTLIDGNIRLSIRVWIINAGRRGNRANTDEPSDVKSAQRPRKRGFTANVSPGVRLPSISGVGSGLRGWMTAGSLTSSVNLRFLFANSSRKQHDDAALRSASPLERPKSEAALPTTKPRNTPQITTGRPRKLAN